MSRTIVHRECDSDEVWALDKNHAQGKAIGMTQQEAEAWSLLCDFESAAGGMFGVQSHEWPVAFAGPFAALRNALLALPVTRELGSCEVDAVRRDVR